MALPLLYHYHSILLYSFTSSYELFHHIIPFSTNLLTSYSSLDRSNLPIRAKSGTHSIKSLDWGQRCSAKFILNNYIFSKLEGKNHTSEVNSLSLWLELLDVTFLISYLKIPQDHFILIELSNFEKLCITELNHNLTTFI